ncbi:type II restriction enzyme [Lacticaseibacillus nasuensis]|uniref:type II restriction enzyme n=1 Tax=Lacticaseibacillus nasuensis TaxID=944671 RepID=UPI0006D071C0|nr:hypothetical protein [Lacticaseibacillus nasuensis]
MKWVKKITQMKQKNQVAWESLFDKLDILTAIERDQYFVLTAEQINKISHREARLMTKFDWPDSRPDILIQNGISILPINRGTYILGTFNPYSSLKIAKPKPITATIPNFIQSFDTGNISSESVALNIAEASGMINQVLGESGPIYSTLTGRMSSDNFKFRIDGLEKPLAINAAQIEIDATYESAENIAIIEAKRHVPEQFMVRQLYYPYRAFLARGITKPLIPIYFTIINGLFSFHVYEFKDPNNYSSIHEVKQLDFILNERLTITVDDIQRLLHNAEIKPDKVTIPQADTLARSLDMIHLLATPQTKFDIAEHYGFAIRQSDYYFKSLEYLGIAERSSDRKYQLTKYGIGIDNEPNLQLRYLAIMKVMFTHEVINKVANYYLKTAGNVESSEIAKIVYHANKAVPLNEVTSQRRASTILSWVRWIFNLIDE